MNPHDCIDGKSILVTGGTGSFGRRFIRTLVQRFQPKRVIVFSRDELKQSEMASELSPDQYPALRYFLGDVRDRDRLEMALQGVHLVVHAAALKQVTAAEYNPFECVHTNIFGAENIVRAAIRANVDQVIALSTDKAVNPINLYGASKLAADKIFIAANNLSGSGGPRFSVVRYGNVIGSRGSVIPFFLKLIREKAQSLPITDRAMTRFWITLQHSVDFVLSSTAMMKGGEIFVPKLYSMKLVDLATALAPQLPQTVVGIRPGEKLHEALITEDDAKNTVELADGFIILPAIKFWTDKSPYKLPKVPPDFSYTSNNNLRILQADELTRFLQEDGLVSGLEQSLQYASSSAFGA